MTTITLNTKAIRNAVALTANYTAKVNDFQGQVIISGRDGALSVKATDYVEAVEVREIAFVCSDLTTDSFETFAVDAKKLLTVLKAANTEQLSIEIKEGLVQINYGGSKIKIQKFAKVEQVEFTIGETYEELKLTNELIDGLKGVLHAIDTDNPKASMNGALMELREDGMSFVSTDAKRLSIVENKVGCEIYRDAVIPKRAIQSIEKLFNGYELVSKIDDFKLVVEAKNLIYSTKLINNCFPEWRRIVPVGYSQSVTLSKTQIRETIKEASLFDKELHFVLDDGSMLVKDLGGNTEVQAEYTKGSQSQTIEFSINSNYLVDFMDATLGEEIVLSFTDKLTPIGLTSQEGHQEICMPIVTGEKKSSSEEENTEKAA